MRYSQNNPIVKVRVIAEMADGTEWYFRLDKPHPWGPEFSLELGTETIDMKMSFRHAQMMLMPGDN